MTGSSCFKLASTRFSSFNAGLLDCIFCCQISNPRIEQRAQALNQQALSLWLKLKTLKQLHQALTTELGFIAIIALDTCG
jgi:hypothetical protein